MDTKQDKLLDQMIEDVREEVEYAEARYKDYLSCHEGYAVIKEELDELWDEVKLKSHDYHALYLESKHVACTAIRFMKMCKNYKREVII